MAMLRCIAYCSVPNGEWSEARLDSLQTRIAEKNAARGLTGFLTLWDGRFVQVLEGPALAVTATFKAIAADPDHHGLIKLLDREIHQPAFSGWSAGLPECVDAGKPAGTSVGVERADAYMPRPRLDTPPLLGLMDGIVGRMLGERLRLKPVQTRAMETVDRLIAAAEAYGIRQGIEQVTIEAIASEAAMTPQAVYRYFKHPDDIFRAMFKKRQALGMKRLMEALETEAFSDELDVVHFIVSFTVRSMMQNTLVPRRTKILLIQKYHDIAFQEIWHVAEATHNVMLRRGILPSGVGIAQIATGIAAIAGAMKLLIIRDDAAIDQGQAHAILVRIFAGALGGTP